MRIRNLEKKDTSMMLEWMHDPNVTEFLHKDFRIMTEEDCLQFICKSQEDHKNLHLAVADERDEYMGTVSLKNICNDSAEFAIVMRKCAMGKGLAGFAMKAMIQKGKDMGIKDIYWCVSRDNKRAIRFYDKNGFARTSFDPLYMSGGGIPRRKSNRCSGTELKWSFSHLCVYGGGCMKRLILLNHVCALEARCAA